MTDLDSDSTEALADFVNVLGESPGVTARLAIPSTKTTAREDSSSTCTVTYTGGDLKTLTFGSGSITGTFAESNYDFENWNLYDDLPKALSDIAQTDFVSAPEGETPCTVGDWNFAGTATWETSTGKAVQHLWRQKQSLDQHSFFAHLELTASNSDADRDWTVTNVKGVRERWLGGELVMAQTVLGVGEATAEIGSDADGFYRKVSGNLCIHHLLAAKRSFHEVSEVQRRLGILNFCCHPVGGTATVSFYPESVSCEEGKPGDVPESKYLVTFPTACGDDITLETLDPATGDVTATLTGKAICAR